MRHGGQGGTGTSKERGQGMPRQKPAFRPRRFGDHKARWLDALRRTWNPAKDIRAGDCPDLHEINCFDFFEGMRIVAAIEVQADGTNRLHCCCTVEEDTQLMDA